MDLASRRVCVVTGASRGIGRAIALALASPTNFIYVNYVSRAEDAENVVREITEQGGYAKAIRFNVSKPKEVEEAFTSIESEQGGVDVLIANAGVSIDSLLLRAKHEDIETLVQTNLVGMISVTKAAMKTMLRRKTGDGRVIYISSVVGQMGNAGQSIYSATKSGILGFMKSVAREVASRNITVNAVSPGLIRTDMTEELNEAQKTEMLKRIPLARWGESADVAELVKFLVSPKASYITGQVIAINGGMYL